MPVVSADQLRDLSRALLVSCGTPGDQASIVAEGLVNANLAGYDSHGVLRLPGYLRGGVARTRGSWSGRPVRS